MTTQYTLHPPVVIGVEGIDGAGKGTQAGLLHNRLRTEGFRVQLLDFPRYDEFIGREIGKRLAGEAKLDATQLPPEDFSLWYAVDRMLAFKEVPQDTQIILLNRSTYSNAGFQLARLPEAERAAMKEWLFELEFKVLGIPVPHKMFYLDIDVETGMQLVAEKDERKYVKGHDKYEQDKELLTQARGVYQSLAQSEANFEQIDCVNAQGDVRSIFDIHEELLDKTFACLAGK